ncbi:MAG: HIT family protein [Chitinophagaceae bacterium]|nr:MAG: histidine triad (HIT) protein [Bacteroidetes bacterium OLB11]MCC6447983.1 HIT family protein [Chitinophagaceae bacterium]HMN33170.1 HIT family protein [Chitinophagaceae bacterium]
MGSIFTKIINKEIPSFTIMEDDFFIAFLDINPLVKGHTLVVPKCEIDKVFDLENAYLEKMLVFAKPIAKAIEKSFDCDRCGVSIIGLEVPHTHMHLIPINSSDDLNFTRAKLKLNNEELQAVQKTILLHLG